MKEIEIPFGAKDSELCRREYTIPEGYEAEVKDGKVIVRKKEEPLTEFEKKVFDIAWIAISLGINAQNTALVEFAKVYSRELLELARKQLDKCDDESYDSAYEDARRDLIFALPKWKKTKPEREKAFGKGPWIPSGIRQDKGKHTVFLNGYEISVDELFDKLPKED